MVPDLGILYTRGRVTGLECVDTILFQTLRKWLKKQCKNNNENNEKMMKNWKQWENDEKLSKKQWKQWENHENYEQTMRKWGKTI